MQRDREPEPSILPPPAVMRSAFVMVIPFGIFWAICGSILWELILTNYGTTWPMWVQSSTLALSLTAVYGLFGAVFAVAVRVFFWLLLERRPPRTEPREPRVRRDIPVGQDWRQV
jgi:hypothetical protein